MLCLDDDDDTEGIECLLDAVLDLRRQALLYLQATSEDVDDAGELREPRDVAIGDIPDVNLAEEGQHVVLTERVEVDILDDNHLTILLAEHRRAKDLLRIFACSRGEEAHGLSHTLGRLHQALTLGIVTQQAEYLVVVVAQSGFGSLFALRDEGECRRIGEAILLRHEVRCS